MSTILAVDDSATMRKCLQITFEGTEFKLVTCASASAAVEQVKTLGPALVIADVSLPPTDGYELCSTIKLASPGTPVLILSSKQHPFDPGRGAQADDHIDKPFDTTVLQDRARQLISAAPRADTDIPGMAERAVAPAGQKPVTMPGVPPSSKIPAPRRKRPTPAMMQAPVGQTPQPPGQAGSAAGRRTVPFAMPHALKKTVPGGLGAELKKPVADRTLPMPGTSGQSPGAASSLEPIPAAVAHAPPVGLTDLEPTPVQPTVHQGTPAAMGAAAVSAPLPADLQGKLAALGLSTAQIEGVLALSREVLEQVVWEVVPHLAETMIKEEIRRITRD